MGAGQSKKKHNGKVAPLQDEKIDHHHPSRRFAHVKTDQLAAAHLVDHQRSAKDVSLQREREMEKQRNQAHPSFIGEYAVGRLMQQGTLGTFFEGTSRNSKERVCIKITEPSNLLFEALLQELEALRKLTPHPNIANILAVQQAGAGSSVEIVEERAAGLEVLDFILRRPAFCEREAALLSTQLLHALAHLHAQHLPHRGIKPDAVWIRPLPNSTAPPPKPAPAGLVNKSKSSPPSGPPEKDSPHPPVIPAFSFHVVLLDAGLASLKFKSRADLAPTHFSDPEFLAPELFTCSSSSSSYGASLSPRVARVEESRGGGGRGGEREGGEGGERGRSTLAGAAADIYAVGVLLSVMLSGIPPQYQDDAGVIAELAVAGLVPTSSAADADDLPSLQELPSLHAAEALHRLTHAEATRRGTAAECLTLTFMTDHPRLDVIPLPLHSVLADYIRRRKARKAGVKLARLQRHLLALAERNEREMALEDEETLPHTPGHQPIRRVCDRRLCCFSARRSLSLSLSLPLFLFLLPLSLSSSLSSSSLSPSLSPFLSLSLSLDISLPPSLSPSLPLSRLPSLMRDRIWGGRVVVHVQRQKKQVETVPLEPEEAKAEGSASDVTVWPQVALEE